MTDLEFASIARLGNSMVGFTLNNCHLFVCLQEFYFVYVFFVCLLPWLGKELGNWRGGVYIK